MTYRREKRDTTYVVSLFLKQETVLRTFSSPVPNQIAIQRKRLRFGEEEQQNERARTFIKIGASDMSLAPTWNGWTVSRTYRAGAPHSGAAPMRRTSVLGRWPKTLAEGEFISPEHCNQKGGAALRAAKPKKKDTPGRVLLFGDPAEIRTPDTLLKRQVLCRLSYWVI